LFAELFPSGTVLLDVSQDSPSDASSAPTALSNSQNAPAHSAGPLADNGIEGSPSDLDSAATGIVAEASDQHASASATFIQDPATASDSAFYALSSDAYWSDNESVSHRLSGLGTDGHDSELASTGNGSDATSAADFGSPHVTFSDSTSTISHAEL